MHSQALCFCIGNDRDGGTIFDASPWILKLGFAVDVTSCLFGQGLEIDLCARSAC